MATCRAKVIEVFNTVLTFCLLSVHISNKHNNLTCEKFNYIFLLATVAAKIAYVPSIASIRRVAMNYRIY